MNEVDGTQKMIDSPAYTLPTFPVLLGGARREAILAIPATAPTVEEEKAKNRREATGASKQDAIVLR